MRKQRDELTNRQKAAILLMILGPELSGQVLKHLEERHVEELSLEVARLDKVTADHREQVIKEFHEVALAQDYISEGGLEHARRVLEAAFGPEKAKEILERIQAAMQVVPFEFLKRADPSQLLSFIQDEHPQTIALILAYMPLNSAAMVLGKLAPELR
ncbi:MAG: flagellar motor switch protein FliG, partial [Fimbriimonadales bacterium]